MKKLTIILIFIFSLFLVSCNNEIELVDNYNENSIEIIDLDKDSIKIMQLTDLHFSYGFDYFDRLTFKELSKLIEKEEPDLIVITGDLFMSILGVRLFKTFIKFIEEFKIPWTITFGNHEREYHSIERIVKVLMEYETKYLYFHYGPKLSSDKSHGAANFKIRISSRGTPFLNIYMLDSKDLRTDGVSSIRYPYDYLSNEQVSWYQEEVTADSVESIAFMHIPLMEFLEYDGDEARENIWPQGVNTGFFSTLKEAGKTRAVFVGHDHNNEFSFVYEDVLLAYGRSSGYNAYGTYQKGARIIIFDTSNNLETYLVAYDE